VTLAAPSPATCPAQPCCDRRPADAVTEIHMSKPMDPREAEQKAKKKPGGQQHPNPPRKTDTDNPERNPRDQKGRGGSK